MSGQNDIVPHLLRRCVHGLPELANRVSAEEFMSVEIEESDVRRNLDDTTADSTKAKAKYPVESDAIAKS